MAGQGRFDANWSQDWTRNMKQSPQLRFQNRIRYPFDSPS